MRGGERGGNKREPHEIIIALRRRRSWCACEFQAQGLPLDPAGVRRVRGGTHANRAHEIAAVRTGVSTRVFITFSDFR